MHVLAEPHKGTRGGPSDLRLGPATTTGRFVELSHVIRAGLSTYPGLPAPTITPYLTRQASRQHYAPGAEFAIDQLTLVGNTGTYRRCLPTTRYPDGADRNDISPEQTVGPASSGRAGDRRPAARDRRRRTGRPGCPGHRGPPPHRRRRPIRHTGLLREPALPHPGLALPGSPANGAALVGIDALNIDDTADAERPAHTLLLGAGIPVVENLTGLDQLPPTAAHFTAVPLRIEATGTIPVRAFARLPG